MVVCTGFTPPKIDQIMAPFGLLHIRLVRLVFSAGTVFFSHNNSVGTVSAKIQTSERGLCVLVDSNLDDGSKSESAAGRGVGDGGWRRHVEVGFLVFSRKG